MNERKMSKRKAQRLAKFRQLVSEAAERLGAELLPADDWHKWKIDTCGGVYQFSFDRFPSGEVLTIFGRFDDENRAAEIVDCNHYSGKWNHHFGNAWSAETAANSFAFQLGKIATSRLIKAAPALLESLELLAGFSVSDEAARLGNLADVCKEFCKLKRQAWKAIAAAQNIGES